GKLASTRSIRHRQAFEVLRKVAREAGKTVAQVALNWCTVSPALVAIPKAGSVEHVIEDCGASGWRLSPAQLDALNQAFR
ncbi:MAG: aldo/keto reductase, partial [bacterium]